MTVEKTRGPCIPSVFQHHSRVRRDTQRERHDRRKSRALTRPDASDGDARPLLPACPAYRGHQLDDLCSAQALRSSRARSQLSNTLFPILRESRTWGGRSCAVATLDMRDRQLSRCHPYGCAMIVHVDGRRRCPFAEMPRHMLGRSASSPSGSLLRSRSALYALLAPQRSVHELSKLDLRPTR